MLDRNEAQNSARTTQKVLVTCGLPQIKSARCWQDLSKFFFCFYWNVQKTKDLRNVQSYQHLRLSNSYSCAETIWKIPNHKETQPKRKTLQMPSSNVLSGQQELSSAQRQGWTPTTTTTAASTTKTTMMLSWWLRYAALLGEVDGLKVSSWDSLNFDHIHCEPEENFLIVSNFQTKREVPTCAPLQLSLQASCFCFFYKVFLSCDKILPQRRISFQNAVTIHMFFLF